MSTETEREFQPEAEIQINYSDLTVVRSSENRGNDYHISMGTCGNYGSETLHHSYCHWICRYVETDEEVGEDTPFCNTCLDNYKKYTLHRFRMPLEEIKICTARRSIDIAHLTRAMVTKGSLTYPKSFCSGTRRKALDAEEYPDLAWCLACQNANQAKMEKYVTKQIKPFQRYDDRPISKSLRMALWEHWYGPKVKTTVCYCGCNRPVSRDSFEAGHVIPECYGGDRSYGNLRCICPECNRSMGDEHLEKWRAREFPNAPKLIPYAIEHKKLVTAFSKEQVEDVIASMAHLHLQMKMLLQSK